MTLATIHVLPSKGNGQDHLIQEDLLDWGYYQRATAKDVKSQGGIYGFIYDDEMFDEKLLEALPHYFKFAMRDWDALVLFKKVGDKVYTVPRIFHQHITLGELLNPIGLDLKYLRVLDGWIIDRCL